MDPEICCALPLGHSEQVKGPSGALIGGGMVGGSLLIVLVLMVVLVIERRRGREDQDDKKPITMSDVFENPAHTSPKKPKRKEPSVPLTEVIVYVPECEEDTE